MSLYKYCTDMTNSKDNALIEATTYRGIIEDFVESLQMGEKYGVVRIDWVLNNDIKGLEGGENSWSDEMNWETRSFTEAGISKGVIKVFVEKKTSPISFLAKYCKENRLDVEAFFFPEASEDSTRPNFINSLPDNLSSFQLLRLKGEHSLIPDETANIINEESESAFPSDYQDGKDYLNKFLQYQETYVRILKRTSQRVFSGEPMLTINSAVIIPVITRSISDNNTEILGAYMIITSTFSSKTLKEDKNFKHDLLSLKYACKSLVDEKISQRFFEKLRREAIKSAISAIMSRNMSHNLGSHYMYYTKAYLEQLANSVNDIAPDIRGAAKVLGYVQARMDYLATVISNDKYPYGAVNFKSQIYDELTVDDFSHRHFREDKNKRTTNFLLTNLILSENFTRPDVRSDEDISSNSNQLFLHVKLLKEDNHYMDFTGTWHSSKLKWFKDRRRENPNLPTLTSEEDIKNQLSSLNIALPGGSMSCHALFNVVENFIRNSAKYLQNDINKEEGLICTLAIAPNPDNSSLIDITIYDNKKNANKIVDISRNLTLYELIICKLESLVIIDDQDKISKDNKGFKEMLFSSIWMRAYTFGNDKTYADIVSEINNVSCGESKIELIERYGFSLVRVHETSDGGISINNRKMPLGGECNLGLTITLPVFKQCDTILLSGVKSVDVNNILNIMADIVEVDKEFFKSVYHHVFTRPLLKDVAAGMSIYEKYHKVVTDRFPDIDKYALSLEKAEDHYNSTPKEFQIFFKRHMSTAGNADPCEYEEYAYADTISGGNFTITLLDLFKKGYENGVYKSDDDRIFALKIKESALTRITVIDERLFNSTEKKDYPWLSLKNVRVLNYDDSFDESLKEDASDDESCISSIFVGNSFGDGRDKTHFLTIHLGLIEKILKNSKFVNTLINKGLENEAGCGTYNPLDPIRVRTFMKLLRMHYSEGVQRDIYIAIHSGRGNYSAELEGPLSKYPFISLSALENAFNNSKYQLSQLLYNTVYIGKGFANNI